MITKNMDMKRLLESADGWARVRDGMLKGTPAGTRRKATAMALENARKLMLNENAPIGYTASTNVGKIAKVMLPLIRRVMPTVMAYDLVGVQPMEGPVALIRTMRFKLVDTSPADGTGYIAGQEALSPYVKGCWYSGNESITEPGGAGTAKLEAAPGNRMQVEYLTQRVEATTRRLSARYTLEAMQDAESQFGSSIESDISTGMATQIVQDIDQEIITKLNSLSGVVRDTFDQNRTSGVATSVVDEHASLVAMINRYANDIGRRVRQGAANFAVCSYDIVSVLQDAKASAFVRTTSGDFEAPTNNKAVGVLNGSMRVFVNTLAEDDTILLGYKGSDETSAAAFYCPYIPVVATPTLIDPADFTYVMGMTTRYGWADFTNSSSSLANSADYLAKIAVTNLRFS